MKHNFRLHRAQTMRLLAIRYQLGAAADPSCRWADHSGGSTMLFAGHADGSLATHGGIVPVSLPGRMLGS